MVNALTFFPFCRLRFLFLLTLVLKAAGFSVTVRAAEVTARLDRETVPAGEAAVLQIEVINGRSSDPQPPAVQNFIIEGGRRGYHMSSINGQTTTTTSYMYRVGSTQPGDYTIPPFTLTVDGQEVKTEPLKLKVTPSANQPPAGLPQGNQGSTPPPIADQAAESELGFLTVELAGEGRTSVWVGEIAPVRIKAWLPLEARVNLASNLQPEGSAFTLHNVSPEPKQEVEVRNGKQYRVVTWYGGLSAAKAGTYPPDLKLKAVIAVRDPSARRRNRPGFGRDPFDDPFFDQVLAPMIQKDVVLSSSKDDNAGIVVRALPREGRPANFSGAVGKFTMENPVIPGTWQTGEPQQISVVVNGEGNFNLLRQPDIEPADSWKTYPGQAEFSARDVASFAGAQTFRFNAVARKSGSIQTKLAFSYFDPAAEKYQTITSPPLTVEVTGKALEEEKPLAAAPAPAGPRKPEDPLAPLRLSDTGARSLTPPVFRPFFRPVLIASGAMLLTGLAAARIRRWKNDPQRLAREAAEKATKAALQEAESFAARGDVTGFFTAARRALQARLAALWGRQAHAITLADVTSRMAPDSPIVEFFREADRVSYSPGFSPDAGDLAPWRSMLHDAMLSLATSRPSAA